MDKYDYSVISFFKSFEATIGIFKLENRRASVVLLSKGLRDYIQLDEKDYQEYRERFELYPEYFIHSEDLFRLQSELHYISNHPKEEMRVRFRFHLNQEDPYIWMMSYSHFIELGNERLLYVELHNVENEQKELRHAIAQSTQSRALLDKILDTTQTNIFWKDTNRRFLGANKAFLEYYGFDSLDDILGKTDEDMGWHEDPGPFMNDEERVIHYGETTHRVSGTNIVNGELHYIVASKSPLYINGQIAGLVGSFEDVSEDVKQRKEIEDLNKALQVSLENEEKANLVKSEFMAGMSHDMRTPLTTIIGLANLGINDESYLNTETLYQIRRSSDYLLALINDLLETEKFNTGKMELYVDNYNHDEIMESIYNIIQQDATRNSHDLEVVLSHDIENFLIDRKWLMQILINVINNAIKYTPNGGKVSWHESVYEDSGKKYMMHVIKDTGVGISQDYIDNHLYEPFSREINRLSKSRTSNGLGLSIVKKAIDLMGGSIECESVLGEGTTFTIRIPYKDVEKKEKEEIENLDVLKNKRVLICEDVSINAQIVEAMLENFGVLVDIAENGKVGLSKTIENNYDLILMDMKMPVMDGLEATLKIREAGCVMPIVALTANTYKEDIENCHKSGMNDFIEKPVDVAHLLKILIKYLG